MRARWAALAAIGAIAVVATGCGGDDGGKVERQTFTITERDTDDFAFDDNPPRTEVGEDGPRRLSPGDTIGFRSDLIRGGRDVGDLVAKCTALTSGSFAEASSTCEGTYDFPEGQLTLAVGGRPFAEDRVTGAVTGGTGEYAGATGTFTDTENDNEGDTRTRVTIWVPEDAEDEN